MRAGWAFPLTIVAPDTAPATKLRAVERLGGRIIKVPFDTWWRTFEERAISRRGRDLYSRLRRSGRDGRQRNHRAGAARRSARRATPS